MTTIIQHADVREHVGTLSEIGYDALIVDPPYGEYVHAHAMSLRSIASGGPVSRDLGFASADAGGIREPIGSLVDHARRWSLVFSDIESTHIWRDCVKKAQYVRAVPWIRWSQPQISGDRPPAGCDMVSIWHPPGRKMWSGPGSLTHFGAKCMRGRDKHPTEKPLDLMLALVSWFSSPGETVCDPCCGWGTTGLACELLGRDALLLDLDAGHAERACVRLSEPLTKRDQERARRWVEYQEGWIRASDQGQARYARARADTARVAAALGS